MRMHNSRASQAYLNSVFLLIDQRFDRCYGAPALMLYTLAFCVRLINLFPSYNLCAFYYEDSFNERSHDQILIAFFFVKYKNLFTTKRLLIFILIIYISLTHMKVRCKKYLFKN